MKRLLALAALIPSLASAQSVPQMAPPVTLKGPTGLNWAMGLKADATGGVLTTPTIAGGTATGLGLTGGSASGLTISGASMTGTTTNSGTISGGSLSGVDYGRTLMSGGVRSILTDTVLKWPYMGEQGSVALGRYAGAALPTGEPSETAIGAYALGSMTGGFKEDTAVGTWACRFLIDGTYDTCLGMNAMGAELHASSMIAIGDDAMRNQMGSTGSATAVGTWSARNGVFSNSETLGAQAALGNSGTVTIGGSPTTGDTITLTYSSSSSSITSGSKTVSYTVQSGDSINSIANALQVATQNAGFAGQQTGLQAFYPATGGSGAYFILDYPGNASNGWQVNVASSVSGAKTETVTATGGSQIVNTIAIGAQAAYGGQANLIQQSIFIGTQSGASGVNIRENTCVGDTSCYQNTQYGYNTAIGYFALANATTGSDNTILGTNAATGITTGSDNTILGGDYDSANAGCVTTGGGNVEIGHGACIASPTDLGDLSIQNIIYGTGNNGKGAVISTGSLGFGTNSLAQARFTFQGLGTTAASSTLLVQNANATPSLVVKDDGEVIAPVSFQVPVVSQAPSGSCTAGQIEVTSQGLYACIGGAWKQATMQ